MVANEPEIRDGDMFTIAETCAILGIHRNTLRKYTKDFKIAFKVRKTDGRTLYAGRDIKRLVTTTI